jgi:hypothetical protein
MAHAPNVRGRKIKAKKTTIKAKLTSKIERRMYGENEGYAN